MRPSQEWARATCRRDGRSDDGPRRDEQGRQAEEECPADEDRAAQMDGRAHWATAGHGRSISVIPYPPVSAFAWREGGSISLMCPESQ